MKKDTHNNSLLFNSLEAAEILCVNVSSIKRWTDAGLLECFRSSGGHRKFSFQHIYRYLAENGSGEGDQFQDQILNLLSRKDKDRNTVVFPLIGDAAGQVEYLYRLALSADEENALSYMLFLNLKGREPLRLFSGLIIPLLRRIGQDWSDRRLSVAEEHIVSRTLRNVLIRFSDYVTSAEATGITVMGLSLNGDEHDMVLQMVSILAKQRGVAFLNSGASTPLRDIDGLISGRNVSRLYFSVTFVRDSSTVVAEVQSLKDLQKKYGNIIRLGGAGAMFYKEGTGLVAPILEDLYAVDEDINQLIADEKTGKNRS